MNVVVGHKKNAWTSLRSVKSTISLVLYTTSTYKT